MRQQVFFHSIATFSTPLLIRILTQIVKDPDVIAHANVSPIIT